MRGKYLVCTLTASLGLASATLTVRADQQVQKVSPNNAGFTILPITNGDPSGPPTLDHNQPGALLDPTVMAPGPGGVLIGPALLNPTVPASAVSGPGTVSAVPEPSTIAMLFLGSGCLGAMIAFRRRRNA
jgi:PEP-CTERM motif-containing protein